MLPGLMQHDHPLTTRHLAERMALHGGSEVVDVTPDGGRRVTTYREVATRARRLADGLARLGVRPGDRVGTFAWNSREHLELYLAVPTMGAVLHTVNIRLHEDQTAWIIRHAGDSVLVVDEILVDRIAAIADRLDDVRAFVLIGGGDTTRLPRCHAYEDLVDGDGPDPGPWPDLDDRAAAALCYTSGTTGDPRGVLYSHRSTLMHALVACATDTMAIGRRDRILLVVPMFHANAWGLPFAAMLTGATLIMPGAHLQPGHLVDVIARERATVAGAVATLWTGMLRHADDHAGDLSSLRLALLGGGAAPDSLVRAFRDRHRVRLTQAWGMTETSPIGAFCHPPEHALDTDEELVWRQKAGRIAPLVDARLIADDAPVPHDGTSEGELEVRGPWIASGYYGDPDATPEKFRDGWLRTGDLATIDPDGYIAITDRAKDVIKSGGEWISSVQLEGHLAGHPDVLEAAVVARPDERWDERPVACVALADGADRDPDALLDHLTPLVARWWLPDEVVFVDEVPKTSTGKFDKKTIRARLADGTLTLTPRRRSPAA